MNKLKSLFSGKLSANKHNISSAFYGEKMYFIDTPSNVTEREEKIFQKLLDENQGVGLIAGIFDDHLTIRMFSGTAERILGYESIEEFLSMNKPSLHSLLVTDYEKEYMKDKLLSPNGEIWGYCLSGKDENMISVRIGNATGMAQDGEKAWYMSIRKFGEYQLDSLTGGYNRSFFIHRVKKLVEKGVDLTDYAILFTNVMGFKAINDVHGSEVGDDVLRSLYNHFISSDLKPIFCARKESDKFLMLVKKENLDLEKLTSVMKTPCIFGGKTRIVESVCGIYNINDNSKAIEMMIDCAKMATRHIEDAFVQPYSVFNPTMRTDYLSYSNALSRFDEALENDEFKIYYQPIVDAKTEKIVSVEALVRWESDEYGVISPNTFIKALEENGNIVKLDTYVYKKIADILHDRTKNGKPIIPSSINLSQMNFFDEKRIDTLYKQLTDDELAREYIRFEITEIAHKSMSKTQAAFVKTVNELGGMVCIDDFGVSNSSLDLLSQYDFAILKLDIIFIQNMMESKKVQSLVKSTINMAHDLNMKIIAEGVETKEQLEMLRGFKCDYIQGYYFSKPLPQKEFEEYLSTHL